MASEIPLPDQLIFALGKRPTSNFPWSSYKDLLNWLVKREYENDLLNPSALDNYAFTFGSSRKNVLIERETFNIGLLELQNSWRREGFTLSLFREPCLNVYNSNRESRGTLLDDLYGGLLYYLRPVGFVTVGDWSDYRSGSSVRINLEKEHDILEHILVQFLRIPDYTYLDDLDFTDARQLGE